MSKGSEAVRDWRIRTKKKMVRAMGAKCQCCGYDKHYGALDFHHINPEEKDISLDYSNPKAWTRLVEELRKCVLVCSNCHREIHGNVRSIPEGYQKFDEQYATMQGAKALLDANYIKD